MGDQGDTAKGHRWVFCDDCRIETVICGTCGNNVCNGWSGEFDDGKGGVMRCPDCESAYRLWQSTPINPVTGRRKPVESSLEGQQPDFRYLRVPLRQS
jgi:DNA-directed RNA polymerase subunit RPC12/RpoP